MNTACIKCGVLNNVWLDVENGRTFHCRECDEDFTVDEVEEFVGEWQKALAWAATHPARQAPECNPVAGKVG
jgi:hypothetical protein